MTKKIKFGSHNRDELLEHFILNNYRGVDSNNIAALRRYYESGDIHEFLHDGGETVDQWSIFYMGANPSMERLQYRLKYFWEDVLKTPEKYSGLVMFPSGKNIDHWFNQWSIFLFNHLQIIFFSEELNEELFHWIFGTEFKAENAFPMTFGEENWQPIVHLNPNWVAANMLSGFRNYFFDMRDWYAFDPSRVEFLQSYFFSTIEHVDRKVFTKKITNSSQDTMEGKYELKTLQYVIRLYIAYVNGVLSEEQEEDGYTEIIVSEPEALAKFHESFEALPLPKSYHNLVEFVKKSGSNYLFA